MIFFETLILLIISAVLYLYWNFKKKLAYFEENGMPYKKPNFFFGNLADAFLLRKSLFIVYNELYEKFRPHKFVGFMMLQKPAILMRDPELIKCILTKDFSHFQNRGITINRDVEPLAYHLFNMRGDEWKNLRIKLTSTFTTGKMKMMFPLIKECGEHLTKVINKMDSEESFNIKDLAGRFTTDSIGSCAFGIETHSLDNPDSEFRIMGKEIFKSKYSSMLRTAFPTLPKSLIKFFNLRFVSEKVSNFFMGIVDSSVKYREENNVIRYDFLDLMIALKNNTTLEKFHDSKGDAEDLERFMAQIGNKHVKCNVDVTVDVMAAQCFLFFVAGFETTSTALSFLMMELALNPKIQDKVRNEIKSVLQKHNGDLTYESMKEMTYTDMVIAEILRKHPPATLLIRLCNEPYMIPDTKTIIPENITVVFPVHAIHHDKEYYERPEDFYPEHFTEEAKASRPHYSYLPFGEGPRICIAERFAKMKVKIGLVSMLQNFSYQVSPKMKFPIEFEKNFGLLVVKNGIWLKCQKI